MFHRDVLYYWAQWGNKIQPVPLPARLFMPVTVRDPTPLILSQDEVCLCQTKTIYRHEHNMTGPGGG